MTAKVFDRDDLKRACLTALDAVALEHPAGHRGKLAARCVLHTRCLARFLGPVSRCHAVRAPGSNVTAAPAARPGGSAVKSGSMRTVPVNQSPGPFAEGCDPARVIFMSCLF